MDITFSEGIFNLTKGIYIPENSKQKSNSYEFKDTLEYGFVLSPEVTRFMDDSDIEGVLDGLKGTFLSSLQWESTFHSSWEAIKRMTDREIAISQYIHYLTVYLCDNNLLDQDYIYIPRKEIPEEIPLIEKVFVVKPVFEEGLRAIIYDMIASGSALSEKTTSDLMEVSDILEMDKEDLLSLSKNREFSCKVREKYGIVPHNPEDFIRQVSYVCTGSALLIKNADTVRLLTENSFSVTQMFVEYDNLYGLHPLARIFYRYKPLFLALRSHDDLRPMINKIRRLAPKYHRPMEKSYLDSLTEHIRNDEIDLAKMELLKLHLEECPVYRSVQLINHLAFMGDSSTAIAYTIRNGKVWSGFHEREPLPNNMSLFNASAALFYSIKRVVSKNLDGKKVYVPDGVHYTLPTSEKNFIGGIPEGSYVEFPEDKDALIGVHWFDNEEGRVDLDLSCMDDTAKIGWDAHYNRREANIWFSGDETSAPKPRGASEFFRLGKNKTEKELSFIFYLNHFTSYSHTDSIDYNMILAFEDSDASKRSIIDLNKALFRINDTILTEKIIGLYVQNEDYGKRFYFMSGVTGRQITVKGTKHHKALYQNTVDKISKYILLEDVLGEDVELVDNPEEADIDFSLDKVNPQIFINLLKR